MSAGLHLTIEKLQSTFKENGMNFDGQEENFWQMLNDPEIQKAIVKTMEEKLKKAKAERELIDPGGCITNPGEFLRLHGH